MTVRAILGRAVRAQWPILLVGLIFLVAFVLAGANFWRRGSLLIGILQTLPLTVDKSLLNLGAKFGWTIAPDSPLYPIAKITLAQTAPILPYLLLVLILIFRPRGLLGSRED